MNIAFFTNYIFTPHYETELELIQIHLDKGDTVYHFVCDAHLLSCDFNPKHELLKCSLCIAKRKKGQELLSGKGEYIEIKISDLHNPATYPPPAELHFDSIAALRSFKTDNFEIGEAALSSLVSIVREPEPDLQVHHTLLSNILLSSNYIYQYFQKQLINHTIATFYIFNGRFAINRAALRAAQKLNVHAYVHERGNNFEKYELFENVLPHEIIPYTNRIIKHWEANANNDENRKQVAHNFFQDRAAGKEQGWISFTKEQKRGLLPSNWDENQENIVVFTSSEDEYVSIGKEWNLGVFVSQTAVIRQLMNDERLTDKKIWVRLHPNMRSMAKHYLDKTFAALQGNIELILPDSEINSYDLMHSASKVVTFGSTVGIEATYWGKPSILLGPSFYKFFEVTHNPADYEEFVTLLNDKDLKVCPQENTLQFSFYANSYGIPYIHYKPKNLFEGEFKKADLNQSFDFQKWKSLIDKPGIQWLYNKISKMKRDKLYQKYV